MRRAALVLLVAGLAGSAPSARPRPGAEQRQQFRGAADLVSIYATVIDKDRRHVPDLRKEDFVVTDDGKPQTIAFFTNEVQPFSVILMLDRSGTMSDHYDLARDAAVEFVRHMLPKDKARIGSFSDEIRISPPEFTSNHQELIRILHTGLTGLGASPVWTAIDRAITTVAPLEGRRIVLVLSDGHDQPMWNQPYTRLDALMDRARTADVMIYAIGFSASSTQLRDSRSRLPFGIPVGRGVPGNPRSPIFGKSVQPPDPALKDLADVSGGGYFELEAEADLGTTFARVADELHRQYLLGFTPAKLDGKEHEIEVRVKRRGVDVRARRHYVAEPSMRFLP